MIKISKDDPTAFVAKDYKTSELSKTSSEEVLVVDEIKQGLLPKQMQHDSKQIQRKRSFPQHNPRGLQMALPAAVQDTRENGDNPDLPHSPLKCVYNPEVSDISIEGSAEKTKCRKLDELTTFTKSNRNKILATSSASKNSCSVVSDESDVTAIRTAVLDQLSLRKKSHLGSASCSHVVLCECKCSPRNQAVVKFYSKNSYRFHTEVAALKRLKHPGVIRMITYTSSPDQKALVLRYCPYGNLASHIGKLSLLTAVRFFYKIAEALHYIHGKDIIHGDIKLENILIDAEYKPQISDFDLAVLLPPDGLYIRGRRGTTGYVAPEMEEEPTCLVDGLKTDSYSLGAVLLCMLFETKLKKRLDLYSVAKKAHWPDLPIARQLRHILKRLVTYDSDKRWDLYRLFEHLGRHPEAIRPYLDDQDRQDLARHVMFERGFTESQPMSKDSSMPKED